MKRSTLVLLGGAAALLLYFSTFDVAERIDLAATGDVPLIEPSETGKANPLVVAVLRKGEKARVLGCNPRKSDIDVLVQHDGKLLAVRGGSFTLDRRSATIRERLNGEATTQCFGLLRRSG
jgi:hypothetical protein